MAKIKSGVIKDVEVAIKLVDAILEKDESIKSVVFCGKERYDVFYRDFPWWFVEFPVRCHVVVYDGSVFVREV